ncbi:unnamed protein product [Schistocephalus solidus]|uniref:Macro domain-containing protein n=1 Tax=Schistocephalus solidus TaxID=70667 RepID=A0A183TNY4_SCHSO|nr:unnamed protein product [Schistocephalus solidus]
MSFSGHKSILMLAFSPSKNNHFLWHSRSAPFCLFWRKIILCTCFGLLGGSAPQDKPDLLQRLSLIQKDITKLQVDAIVNAANESLLGGGGVDGCIHRAAGPELVAECRTLHGCAPGSSVITKGYKLPASHVIHTVGPRNKDPNVLKSCYETSLALCSENGLKTVAFPCIATGIFGKKLYTGF